MKTEMNKPLDLSDDATTSSDHEDSAYQRALREYERFLERGLGEHDSLSEWLATERELRSRLRPPSSTPSGAGPGDSSSA